MITPPDESLAPAGKSSASPPLRPAFRLEPRSVIAGVALAVIIAVDHLPAAARRDHPDRAFTAACLEQADAMHLGCALGAVEGGAGGFPVEAGLHGALREAIAGVLRSLLAVFVMAVRIAGAGEGCRHFALPGLERGRRARGVAAGAVDMAEGAADPVDKVVAVARRRKQIESVEIECHGEGPAL